MCGNLDQTLLRLGLLVVLAALLCGSSLATEFTFPPAKNGVWELTAVRTLPDGKTQSWKLKANHCQDASLLFQGYWGLGVVEKAGCRFESTELSLNRYKILSECMVRGAGKAVSEATVTLTADTAFEMDVNVREGRRHYHGTESGQRVADCTQ